MICCPVIIKHTFIITTEHLRVLTVFNEKIIWLVIIFEMPSQGYYIASLIFRLRVFLLLNQC